MVLFLWIISVREWVVKQDVRFIKGGNMWAFVQKVFHDLVTINPHTLFVHFPIALCGSALFFILLALWRKSDILEIIAFANIALATISTLATGIMGIRDNAAFYAGLAPNHWAKIILASTLLVVTSVMAIARWRNKNLFHSASRGLYIAGFFVCFGIVSVLGFLGSVILYGF
jgi:uncharacterized membrane protein